MTTQSSEKLLYNGKEYLMRIYPLDAFFRLSRNRAPFLVTISTCWRGYVGTWSLVDGKLWLDSLRGYIARGSLVKIAGEVFGHFKEYNIDLENPAMCSRITLADIFPGAEGSVFAYWFSGKIKVPLNDEVKLNNDGDEVVVKRTLVLRIRNGRLILEDVVLKYLDTPREIENGLTSTDVSVRRQFATSLESKATPEQIARGILDDDSAVRVSFMRAAYSSRECSLFASLPRAFQKTPRKPVYSSSARFSFTPEQLERVLTDTSDEVRMYAMSLLIENFAPTSAQLERWLIDKNQAIRCDAVNHFGDQLTPEQIERGLLDDEINVRAEFAAVRSENDEDQFTPEQIERGLTDEDEEVRMGFIDNDDVVLSPKQIQRGLKDSSIWIQLEIASRYNCELTQAPTIDPDNQTIINNLYEINGTMVRKRDLFREGFA